MQNKFNINTLYESKNYDYYTDRQLLARFGSASCINFEKYFLYKEILKRQLSDELIAKEAKTGRNLKLKKSEFIIFEFKGGFHLDGGLAQIGHFKVFMLLIFFGPGALGLLINEIFINKLHILSSEWHAIAIILCLISLFMFFFALAGVVTTSKIILTNYRLGVSRTFFKFFTMKPMLVDLSKAAYLNNIHNMHFYTVNIFWHISNTQELLQKTRLWLSLIKITEKPERIRFSLSLEKSIFLFETLFLIVQKNGGQIYNIPFKIYYPHYNKASLDYQFSHCDHKAFLNFFKSISFSDLLNLDSNLYFGLSNLSRLSLYATSSVDDKSDDWLPSFLSCGLLPRENILTILPVNSLIPAIKKYVVLTTGRLLLINQTHRSIDKELSWENGDLTAKWTDEWKVVFSYRGQVLWKVSQEEIDFPFHDVLKLVKSVEGKINERAK